MLLTSEEVANVMLQLLAAKDAYTAEHSQRVAEYSHQLGRSMGLSPYECHALYMGGLLHDVGKIGIHDHILKKAGPLTAEEFREMKQHTDIGFELVNRWVPVQAYAEVARDHHLRPDGRGYPMRYTGEQYKSWGEVSLITRVITVADVFDVLWCGRTFAEQKTLPWIVEEFQRHRDTQFDSDVVAFFVRWLVARFGEDAVFPERRAA